MSTIYYLLWPVGLVKSNGDRIIDNYGKLKLTDNKNMINDDTTYIIGSCSKSMTATAIMKIFYMKEPNNQNPHESNYW